MPVKTAYTYETEQNSGNVAELLSLLSGVDENELEDTLSRGVQPMELAVQLGVDDEFGRIIKERVHIQLYTAVKNRIISKKYAAELEISFKEGLLNQ